MVDLMPVFLEFEGIKFAAASKGVALEDREVSVTSEEGTLPATSHAVLNGVAAAPLAAPLNIELGLEIKLPTLETPCPIKLPTPPAA
jgi:hypothetical protein